MNALQSHPAPMPPAPTKSRTTTTVKTSDEPCPGLARLLAAVLVEQAEMWERGSDSAERAPLIRELFRLWQGFTGQRADSEDARLKELLKRYILMAAFEVSEGTFALKKGELPTRAVFEFLRVDVQHKPELVIALEKPGTLATANRLVKALRDKDAQGIGTFGNELLKKLSLPGKWADVDRAARLAARRKRGR